MSSLSEPGLPLGPVLGRLGQEALDLASLIERAEIALHAVLDGLTFLPVGVGHDLQRIDLVRQSLDDIARLLEAAALAVPPASQISPATFRGAVQLAGLAARLSGAIPVAGHSEQHAEDDLGLF